MDNRRLFLAVLLSLAIMLLWQFLFPAKPPKPAPAQAPIQAPGPAEGTEETEGTQPAATPTSPEELPAEAPGPGASTSAPPMAAVTEERIVLENERTRALFSNRGAQLVSFELKQHKGTDGRNLELVHAREAAPYPYGLVGAHLAPNRLNGVLFAVVSRDPSEVSFRYSGPEGVAEKRFRFDKNGLLESEVTLPGRRGWGLVLGPGVRNPTAAELDSRYEARSAVYDVGGDAEVLNAKKAEPKTLSGRTVRWVGLEDNYYLTAVIPRSGLARAVLEPVLVEPGKGGTARFLPVPPKDQLSKEQDALSREFYLLLEPEADSLAVTAYWGAKEYDRLAALPYGLEKTVSLGTFGILARPLLAGLHWIFNHVVRNYGWAIILMTVLIKVLLLPLTHKSYVSMRKMQELNPRMQSIRDKYRGKTKDKQGRPNLEAQRKMNEEIMGLYKAEGVNPAGGCLPMILQLPILFAFYRLLTAAVELRNAPWIFWIHDLSAKDPYYVLPIIMSVTQFLQQRMTPMTGDPAQRRMFQLMPFFMLILFLPSPSGLVLYWLTNNVLTILQQGVYNHLKRRQAA
ncbi:MAG TPA: membrane protein insertase YidC [Thermoanaerobaculia bacterium]|nr:membrane protein insertase YidC [Thermoanaerobaculia bacterium]